MLSGHEIAVQVEARGRVPEGIPALAAGKVRSLLRLAGRPVLSARVTLTMAADPAVARPAVARASVDVSGRIARAQAAGQTMRDAVEHMAARLRAQLDRLAPDWEARRGSRPQETPGEWRHQSVPARRTPYFPRSLAARQVTRHGSYAAGRRTPEEAIAELDLLEYDFHLYADKITGQDTVIYRTAGGYRLAQVAPRPYREHPLPESVTRDEQAAPRLTVTAAIARLEATGQRFVFFADAATGRGSVIYHRYDGHYGLVTGSHGRGSEGPPASRAGRKTRVTSSGDSAR